MLVSLNNKVLSSLYEAGVSISLKNSLEALINITLCTLRYFNSNNYRHQLCMMIANLWIYSCQKLALLLQGLWQGSIRMPEQQNKCLIGSPYIKPNLNVLEMCYVCQIPDEYCDLYLTDKI